MAKYYKEVAMDTICKHCGQRYGRHNAFDDGCPLFDADGNCLLGHSKTQFFEPRETFLEDLTNGKGVSDADLGDVLKKLSDL